MANSRSMANNRNTANSRNTANNRNTANSRSTASSRNTANSRSTANSEAAANNRVTANNRSTANSRTTTDSRGTPNSPNGDEQPVYGEPLNDDEQAAAYHQPPEYQAEQNTEYEAARRRPASVSRNRIPRARRANEFEIADDEPPAARPSSNFDFASRLDLEDSLDRVLDGAEEDLGFDADAAREFDREAAREFDAERPRNLDSVIGEHPPPPDLELDDDDDPANEFIEHAPSDRRCVIAYRVCRPRARSIRQAAATRSPSSFPKRACKASGRIALTTSTKRADSRRCPSSRPSSRPLQSHRRR